MKRRPGFVVWLTGLSGAGKSTTALALAKALEGRRVPCTVLDGDDLRQGLNRDLGYSADHRSENVRRAAEVARLFADAGLAAIVAFVSPYESDRRKARGLITRGRFIEVFLDCPVEICERRDPKGLYRKVRSGTLSNLTGVDLPYESPKRPEVVLKTAVESVPVGVRKIISCLEGKRLL